MKLSIISKPISSPGRSDKFPPPLMRFLRSNVGSRSRGRSRSSPMFITKLKSAAGTEPTQEPTSPKVTCMGQVRVRRSKSKQSGRPGKNPTKRRRRWILDALHCHRSPRSRRVSITCVWRKWASCCHLGCGRRRQDSEAEKAEESTNWGRHNEAVDDFLERGGDFEEEEDQERIATAKLYAIAAVAATATATAISSSPCSPPKNALLLTRCRSAPYRSSSLASRFWGSPLKDETEEVLRLPENEESTASDDGDGPDESAEQPKKNSNVSSRSSDPESRVHPENEEIERFLKEAEGSISKDENFGEQKLKEEGVVVRLKRCKSEPARTAGQKLELIYL